MPSPVAQIHTVAGPSRSWARLPGKATPPPAHPPPYSGRSAGGGPRPRVSEIRVSSDVRPLVDHSSESAHLGLRAHGVHRFLQDEALGTGADRECIGRSRVAWMGAAMNSGKCRGVNSESSGN